MSSTGVQDWSPEIGHAPAWSQHAGLPLESKNVGLLLSPFFFNSLLFSIFFLISPTAFAHVIPLTVVGVTVVIVTQIFYGLPELTHVYSHECDLPG